MRPDASLSLVRLRRARSSFRTRRASTRFTSRHRGPRASAELDAVDLYRFSIASRSTVRPTLRTNADLDFELRNEGGDRISPAANDVERRLPPGRYFVAVRARDGGAGRYVLRRLARVITSSDMLVEGGSSATISPGASVGLALQVCPAVDGPARMLIWRVTGSFVGSRHAAPSEGGTVRINVEEPLED